MLYLLVTLLGACIGSFLNVIIHRLPARQSLIHPGSHCPRCESRIRWYDLVPVLSYLFLRGRCRTCKAPIALTYPVVETATALLFLAAYIGHGMTVDTLRLWTLAALMISAAEIDRRHGIIPNRLVLFGLASGAVLQLLLGTDVFAAAAIAALCSAGLLLVFRWMGVVLFKEPGMGMGDVKMAAVIGLFLGWGSLWVLYLAAVLGGTWALPRLLLGWTHRRARISFAPFMAASSLLHLTLPWSFSLW